MDESGEKAFAERAGSGDVLVRSGESPPKLLTKVARAIGDHVVLWVRFPDGSRRKAKPVLGDWMGGTEQRPWPDVAIMGEEPTVGVAPIKIPGPRFRFGQEVEVAYSKGTQTGVVEERSRREFRDKPGEWLYKVSWHGMVATSVLPEKDLWPVDDDLPPCTCVDLEHGPEHDDTCARGEALRTRATQRNAERQLYTDQPRPFDRPGEIAAVMDGWQGTPPAQGTRRQLIRDAIGEVFTEHPRAFDGATLDQKVLKLADAVESALLRWTIEGEEKGNRLWFAEHCIEQRDSHRRLRETDSGYAEYHRGAEWAYGLLAEAASQMRFLDPPGAEQDRARIAELETERDELAEECRAADKRETEWRIRAEQAERERDELEEAERRFSKSREEGKVPAGTKELHVVIAAQPKSPQPIFVEIEDQDGAGVGGLERRHGSSPDLTEIVIPYGRDDEWVQQVVLAAIVAGQEADTPFPADAVNEVLFEFGVRPTFPRNWPSRSDRPATIEAPITKVPDEALAEEKGHPTEDELEIERLYEQREQARAGESRLMEQRNAALGLLRWLIGDLIPPYPGFEEEDD